MVALPWIRRSPDIVPGAPGVARPGGWAGVRSLEDLVERQRREDAAVHAHGERVAAVAAIVSAPLALSAERREVLRLGAVLHDIGKLELPPGILDQPRPLTPAERAIMEEHPLLGAERVRAVPDARVPWVLPLVRDHHERVDGSGYPFGAAGGELGLLAMIVALADTYAALRETRVYRGGLGHGEAMEAILGTSGDGAAAAFGQVPAALLSRAEPELPRLGF